MPHRFENNVRILEKNEKNHLPREASSKSSCNAASCSSGVMPSASDPVAGATGTFGENHRELKGGDNFWLKKTLFLLSELSVLWGKNMARESAAFNLSPWLKSHLQDWLFTILFFQQGLTVQTRYIYIYIIIEGSLNSKLPTIWRVEKQMKSR